MLQIVPKRAERRRRNCGRRMIEKLPGTEKCFFQKFEEDQVRTRLLVIVCVIGRGYLRRGCVCSLYVIPCVDHECQHAQ